MLRILITRQSRYPIDAKAIKAQVENLLKEKGMTNAEMSIALVGERKMKELARKHLGEKNTLHEVLSFPFTQGKADTDFPESPEGFLQLGEVVVCYPEARRIAIKRNKLMDEIVGDLAEHGTLHLLGIHHN